MTWIDKVIQLTKIKKELKNFIVYSDYEKSKGEDLIEYYGEVCAKIQEIRSMSTSQSMSNIRTKTIEIKSKL